VHIDMAGDAEPAAEGTVTSVHRTPTKEAGLVEGLLSLSPPPSRYMESPYRHHKWQ
jgi:hypothetical protein